jgi:hypothetical protein
MCLDNLKSPSTNDAKERIYRFGHDVANFQAYLVPFGSLRNSRWERLDFENAKFNKSPDRHTRGPIPL